MTPNLMTVSIGGGLVLCGLLAALVAAFKGRSAIGFFIWGCLTSIVGIILAFCLPTRRTVSTRPIHEFILAIQFAVLVGLAAVAISAFHVVITPELAAPKPQQTKLAPILAVTEDAPKGMQFTIIPKDHLTFRETWVDTRGWNINDEHDRPIAAKIRAINPALLDHVRKAATTQPISMPVVTPHPTPRVVTPPPTPQPQKQLTPPPAPKYEPNIFDEMEKDKK